MVSPPAAARLPARHTGARPPSLAVVRSQLAILVVWVGSCYKEHVMPKKMGSYRYIYSCATVHGHTERCRQGEGGRANPSPPERDEEERDNMEVSILEGKLFGKWTRSE